MRELQQVAAYEVLWATWLEHSARLRLHVLHGADANCKGRESQGAARGLGRESVDEQVNVSAVTRSNGVFLNSHAVCRRRRAPPPWSVFYLRASFGSKSFLHSIPRSFYMSAPHCSPNISISDRHHHHRYYYRATIGIPNRSESYYQTTFQLQTLHNKHARHLVSAGSRTRIPNFLFCYPSCSPFLSFFSEHPSCRRRWLNDDRRKNDGRKIYMLPATLVNEQMYLVLERSERKKFVYIER
jgi:hypothetical protein